MWASYGRHWLLAGALRKILKEGRRHMLMTRLQLNDKNTRIKKSAISNQGVMHKQIGVYIII